MPKGETKMERIEGRAFYKPVIGWSFQEIKPTGLDTPSTLYIGEGKLFTEEELKAFLDEIWKEGSLFKDAAYKSIAAKHGITL